MKKLAILGPQGTFSDNASRVYIRQQKEEIEQVFYPSIDEAFHAIGEECPLGIIPIENTLDGYVQRTLDLLLEMDVHIERQVTVPVKFAMAANARDTEGIKRLYVQFKSSGQCRRFIDSLSNVEIVITESNMESYYQVAQGIPGEAAIIPAHMTEECTAPFIIENVTDSDNNDTRFVVVAQREFSKAFCRAEKDIRVSLYVMPEVDRPGILFEILKFFSEKEINLTSIMSRPTKKDMGTYNFFMEFESEYDRVDEILQLLDEMKKLYTIKVLGMYSA